MYSNGKNSEHVQQELLYGQSRDGCVKFFDKSEAVWEGGREGGREGMNEQLPG